MLTQSKSLFPMLCGLALAFPLNAKVITLSLEELIARSELIVVGKIEKVTGTTAGMRYAKAGVTEVWKGARVDTVEFLATSMWACDVSDANEGETAVLFLIEGKASRSYQIAHSGRGRMPQRTVGGRLCVDLYGDLRLPDGITTLTNEGNAWVRCVDVASLKAIVERPVEQK